LSLPIRQIIAEASQHGEIRVGVFCQGEHLNDPERITIQKLGGKRRRKCGMILYNRKEAPVRLQKTFAMCLRVRGY